MTRTYTSAGMMIQFFDFVVHAGAVKVYEGDTYFGFFPATALLRQGGIRDASPYQPSTAELGRGLALDFPSAPPLPGGRLLMVDRIECWVDDGGPHGLGFLRVVRGVDPDEWFFRAHFHQDPVMPGSLGLEAFLQAMKFIALARWGSEPACRFEAVAMNERHEWVYRGQVIPTNARVCIEVVVTRVDEERRILWADGYLAVDGRVIYSMKDFSVQQRSR